MELLKDEFKSYNPIYTKKDFTLDFMNHGIITVPKGTEVTHETAMGYDVNYNFVLDVSWVKPFYDDTPNLALIHDINTYGINVPKEYM